MELMQRRRCEDAKPPGAYHVAFQTSSQVHAFLPNAGIIEEKSPAQE